MIELRNRLQRLKVQEDAEKAAAAEEAASVEEPEVDQSKAPKAQQEILAAEAVC